MEKIYSRASTINGRATSGFCPGCMHSTVHKLVAEVIDELSIQNDAVVFYGIGCCILGHGYNTIDSVGALHGRALAVASAYKRTNKDTVVYTYQGDGDLASIGLSETVYAANRGENLTVIFINNSTYGMTGGQMAPTTLVGQKATTAPYGRNVEEHGEPIHVCELLNTLSAPRYLERVACNNPKNIMAAKKAIKKAFQNQLDGKGFSLVEIMSNCPTNWGMSPLETLTYMEENTMKEFELGVFRDK